ncbi:MAG: right-handed parallel beta-helix repeat-containing protein, partial [Anaerolineales bacterium]
SGTVSVQPGVTLTITPGVTIFGGADAELVIAGVLVAEGTPAAPIYFTSSAADPAPGDWIGIRVTKESHAFSLRHALVQYAQHGVYVGSSGEGAAYLSGTVSYCTLQHNQYGARVYTRPDASPWGQIARAEVTLTHNYVYSNTVAGVSLQTNAGGGGAENYSLVEHNRFEENATGIHVYANSWWIGYTDNRPVIRNNALRNNHDYGIDLVAKGSSDSSGSDTRLYPRIEHNLLEGNPTGLRLYLDPLGSDGTQVLDATVRYNTFRHSAYGIRMEHEESYDTLTAAIEQNVFYGFDEPEAYAIANPTGRPLSADDNYWGADEEAWAGGPAGNTSGTVTVETFLTAADPPLLTHLSPGSGEAGDTVVLHGANFGKELFKPHIIFTDDLLGRIDFVGMNTVEMNAELPLNVSPGAVHVVTQEGVSNPAPLEVGEPAVPDLSGIAATWSATASGTVTEDTVWSEPTLLSGTVSVQPGVTLTITPGVTIFGGADAELVIAGALVAEGTPAAPIYFTSSAADPAPGDWTGIHVTKDGGLSLRYALVQYAQHGVDFRTDETGPAYLSGTVSHCTLQHNERGLRALASPTAHPNGGNVTAQVTVTHNYVYSNTVAGVTLQTSAGYRTVKNYSLVAHNRFEENATGIHVYANSWWIGYTDNRPVIRNNALRNNHDYGIDLVAKGSSDSSGSDTRLYPRIEHNLLEGNPTGLRLYLDPLGSDGTQVLDATVRYNTFRHSAYGIRMEHEESYDTLTAAIEQNVFYGFDEPEAYAIANPTGRPLSADDNYWGADEEAWAGGPAGNTSGTVTVETFLTAADPPVLTHLAPGSGEAGEWITLHGANFGKMNNVFIPLVLR